MTLLMYLVVIAAIIMAYILGTFNGEKKSDARHAELAQWRAAREKIQQHKENHP